MSLSATSQDVWPKKKVIDGDTVIAFTPHQVNVLNGVFIDRDECREMKDSLDSQLRTYKALTAAQDSNTTNLEAQKAAFETLSIEQEEIITL